MKWHRNIEVEGVIVANTRHEEHRDENSVVAETDFGLDGAELSGEYEAMQGDEEELQEGD